MQEDTDTGTGRWLFGLRGVVWTSTTFVVFVFVLNQITRFLHRNVVKFDFPSFWPLGMFLPRAPSIYQIALAVIVFILFLLVLRWFQRADFPLRYIIPVAVLLVVATNLIQGWEDGFITPIDGGGKRGIQIYRDAVQIESAAEFVRGFEQNQTDLLVHSRTHPPGAVLSIYLLNRLFPHPAAISFAIIILSTVLTMLFLHGIIAREIGGGRVSRYLVLLFMLIPSIQVYYGACIDALIAAFLLGAYYFHLHPHRAAGIGGMFICIALASFMTFGFLFILPVLAVTEIIARRNVMRSVASIVFLVIAYLLMDTILDFNYLSSFVTAAALENPNGFMLFADPASYIFTRFESVFEMIVFFGPFLSIMAVWGFSVTKGGERRLFTAAVAAVATLAAMFLTGAFRTGETARVCLFAYPFLFLAVVRSVGGIELTRRDETVLLLVVLAQTVCMQLVGHYFW
jgi:hypothetical protein